MERDKLIAGALQKAYFASGCFWGTEYWFMKAAGVKETTAGFMGGHTEKPTYKEVCSKSTGHVETVEALFDPTQTSYEKLLKLYFETHDFTQVGGQGPDVGEQYRSVIFYLDETQKLMAERCLNLLRQMGYAPATSLEQASVFWAAEDYHQEYYDKKQGKPYCHIYRKIFNT